MKNIQLVLDVAGVLITNISPGFWDEMASVSGITYEELTRLFAAEIPSLRFDSEMECAS